MKITKKALLLLATIMSLLMLSNTVFANDIINYTDDETTYFSDEISYICDEVSYAFDEINYIDDEPSETEFANTEYESIVPLTNVTITLNPNGGSVSPTSILRSIGSTFGTGGSLPTPTRSGRVFIAWFDTSAITGGTRVHNNTIVPASGMRTLFARWTDPVRHLGYWWPSANANTTNVPLRFSPQPPSGWQTPMNNAMSNWNTRDTPINFATNSNSTNIVSVGSLAATWYGEISIFYSGSNINEFSVNLNSRTITNDATNLGNFITSVFAHELGHAIGLVDNPVASADGSIMNHSRNRNTLTIPTAYDVTSVNILYSRN
ncbi:MAG: hypothetical protein FWE27_00365 [Defluviitaleaceae bacterium]|nr:hypothetical protein [Defluviitaleaceae bacterium]